MSKRDDKVHELKNGFFKKGIIVGRHRDAAREVEMTHRELEALDCENQGGYGRVRLGGKWFDKKALRKE